MLSNKALAISGSITGSAVAGIGIAYLTDSSKIEERVTESDLPKEEATQKSTKKKISDLLDSDGKVLLEDDRASEWTNNWSKFKANYSDERQPEAPWNLKNWDAVFKAEEVSTEFKTKCKENSKKLVENAQDPDYKIVKDYCTKDNSKQLGDV